MLFGNTKRSLFSIFIPVMLISRKVTQDKRVVTEYAKNNLAYPLVKDTFTILGNSKCEVLSVLDLKDAFHSLRLSENQRNTVAFYHILVVLHICIKGCLWDSMFPLQYGKVI